MASSSAPPEKDPLILEDEFALRQNSIGPLPAHKAHWLWRWSLCLLLLVGSFAIYWHTPQFTKGSDLVEPEQGIQASEPTSGLGGEDSMTPEPSEQPLPLPLVKLEESEVKNMEARLKEAELLIKKFDKKVEEAENLEKKAEAGASAKEARAKVKEYHEALKNEKAAKSQLDAVKAKIGDKKPGKAFKLSKKMQKLTKDEKAAQKAYDEALRKTKRAKKESTTWAKIAKSRQAREEMKTIQAEKAAQWMSMRIHLKALAPTLKACASGSGCDSAQLVGNLLDLSSAAMLAAAVMLPYGPVVAMIGSFVAAFFQSSAQSKPALTVAHIRAGMQKELMNQAIKELDWNMKSWIERLLGETEAMQLLLTPNKFSKSKFRPKKSNLKLFKRDLGNYVNSIIEIGTRLSAGWEAILDYRKQIHATTAMSDTCSETCKNDPEVKWSEECVDHMKDVQSSLAVMIKGVAQFSQAGKLLNQLLMQAHAVFYQQGWPEDDLHLVRLDKILLSTMKKHRASLDVELNLQKHCMQFGTENDIITQRCNVAKAESLSGFARNTVSGFWGGPIGWFTNAFTDNTKVTHLDGNNCNYVELNVFGEGKTCNGECIDGGPGWVEIGHTFGGECTSDDCCRPQVKAIVNKVGIVHVDKSDDYSTLCGHYCSTGSKEICVRPNACVQSVCSAVFKNVTMWAPDGMRPSFKDE